MMNTVYVVDANILIQPYKTYYAPGFTSVFWNTLGNLINSNQLVVIDKVYKELNGSQVISWFNSNINRPLILKEYADQNIVDSYINLTKYIEQSPRYDHVNSDWFTNRKVADPWIIATAHAYGYTIVTQERYANYQVGNKRQTNKLKIPNLAKELGVNYCDLYTMMRNLGITL